ncbi:hypothetical protein MC885_007698, partial [Smutsia gigantea]
AAGHLLRRTVEVADAHLRERRPRGLRRARRRAEVPTPGEPRASAGSADHLVRNCALGPRCQPPPRSGLGAARPPVAMAGLVVSGTQVSYIGQDCREIPEHLGRDCGHFAKRLDLSFNLLRLCIVTSLGLGGGKSEVLGKQVSVG